MTNYIRKRSFAMTILKSNMHKLMLAGWFGVLLFWMSGIPEGSYQQLDVAFSIYVTNILKSSPAVASFLYKFTSLDEAYLNVPVMMSLLAFASYRAEPGQRLPRFIKLTFAFLWLEFWILFVINPFISKIFAMDVRIVPEVNSWISETNRFVGDNTAVISRHVFAMLFLAWFYLDEKTDKFSKFLIYLCAITFALPPVLNIKHWLSDCLFSAWFAYSSVQISKIINLDGQVLAWFAQKK